jgi:hypothetical protein
VRVLRVLAVIASGFLFVPAGRAELTGKDRQEAETMAKAKLYLRVDARWKYYYPMWSRGFTIEPLAVVTPSGHTVDDKAVTFGKREYIWWGSGPNDGVAYGAIKFAGDSVRVWMEGLAPNGNEFMIRFDQIKTLEDFKAAFNRTFSAVPLQDEHPEWPAEIRKAIAERRLIEGMTAEQVRCVIGMPSDTQKTAENGVEVETWHPRQANGTHKFFRTSRNLATGFPARLRFANGKLATIEMASQATRPKR